MSSGSEDNWQRVVALGRLARNYLRRYRDVAPVAGLLYALWQRRKWQHQAELAAAAVREGRFMEQCTFLLVNLDGLKKGADFSSTISVQTLFTRTLRSLMFDNEKMVELVSQAAEKASPSAPLLELGGDGWLVMANINAHLMEACCTYGHVAAACGNSVNVVQFLYGLVNDRTTTNRQQLRVYVIREKDMQNLPERLELDLRRSSFKSAFSVLQSMAASYTAPPPGFRLRNALSMTTGLPSAMGRTWMTFPAALQIQSAEKTRRAGGEWWMQDPSSLLAAKAEKGRPRTVGARTRTTRTPEGPWPRSGEDEDEAMDLENFDQQLKKQDPYGRWVNANREVRKWEERLSTVQGDFYNPSVADFVMQKQNPSRKKTLYDKLKDIKNSEDACTKVLRADRLEGWTRSSETSGAQDR
ncbi:Hypothetical protein SCF082_LOCUS50345 [Durusdinium trenchii]|uniref:Uncharacterized protein n=1 Tax=Durusdinium trenchii TaxID=1381693 RepID=A0ABP0S773_9DINO